MVRTLDLEDTIASPVVRHRVLVSLIKARALLKIVRIPHAAGEVKGHQPDERARWSPNRNIPWTPSPPKR